MKEKILEIKNVTFGYRQENVLENLFFEIHQGDFIALIGSNGSGKSTLIKLILNQLAPDIGEINFSAGIKKEDIGYVPQLSIGSSYDFPITVFELVSLSLYQELRGFRRLKAKHRDAIHYALDKVGMKDHRNVLYSQLSGGQRQRVLIAKALVNQPKFIILDEPTNGIDKATKENLFHLLHHLNHRHGITILMVTHELEGVEVHLNKIYRVIDKNIERVV